MCAGSGDYCTYYLHGSYYEMGGMYPNPIYDQFGYCVTDNSGLSSCATIYMTWYPY